MSWYYADNNERRGPIEEAAFQSMAASGTIKPDTLVWREGFTDWLPYSQVAGAGSPAPAAGAVASTAVAVGTDMGVCSESGKVYPRSELIEIDGRLVSAEYKHVALQRLREGVSGAGQREYAGFWIRVGAKFVDGIILNVAGQIIQLVIGLALKGSPEVAAGIGVIIALGINAGYMIYFTGKYGATPGKMACKIEVIRADGSPMTFGRATGRYFAEMLSGLTLGIGYIMVAFDEEKRSLHDRICDTRVVRKQ
jgi:uncharacterized RDD family membrane protein YckC